MATQLAVLSFFVVFGLMGSIYLFTTAKRLRFQESLRKRLGADEKAASLLRTDDQQVGNLDRLVAESGLGWSMSVFFTRMAVATVLGIIAGWLFGGPLLALFLGAGGVVLFPFIARRAREKRLELCDKQMPQALEVVTLALRAGHPLPTSLAIAAAEAPQPIADELQRAVDEHDLGRPMGDVLLNLGKRLPGSESVHTFVTAVLVLQQTGGNLIAVIDRIIENARARQQYKSKLRALTSEGRSSAQMLSLMPVAFGIMAALADPTYIGTLVSSTGGNITFIVSVALWLIGIFWTRRLVKTE